MNHHELLYRLLLVLTTQPIKNRVNMRAGLRVCMRIAMEAAGASDLVVGARTVWSARRGLPG